MEDRIPRLNTPEILAWADEYYSQHHFPPTRRSGVIAGTSETWAKVDGALKRGMRGLTGHSSLKQLLDEHRPNLGAHKEGRAAYDKTNSHLGGAVLRGTRRTTRAFLRFNT